MASCFSRVADTSEGCGGGSRWIWFLTHERTTCEVIYTLLATRFFVFYLHVSEDVKISSCHTDINIIPNVRIWVDNQLNERKLKQELFIWGFFGLALEGPSSLISDTSILAILVTWQY